VFLFWEAWPSPQPPRATTCRQSGEAAISFVDEVFLWQLRSLALQCFSYSLDYSPPLYILFLSSPFASHIL